MMLRVNDIYLDFNADIDIDRKIKLFENIDEVDGDVSFAFEVELTSNNITALGLPFPDSYTKRVYNVANTEALDNNGLLINKGSIRVEKISDRFASCSFLGGNSNWFALLTGNMTQLSLSRYDEELTRSNIVSSWTRTEGLVYPLIDTGALITRGYINAMTEDFVGCFYAHTLIKEVFQQSGIKVTGELIDDPFYKKLIIISNGRNKQAINDRSSYIGKTVTQTITPSSVVITYHDETTDPYYDGAQNNYSPDRYTADVKMNVVFEVNIVTDIGSGSSAGLIVYVSGVEVYRDGLGGDFGDQFTRTIELTLESGDYIEAFLERTTGSNFDVTGGYFKVTPVFLYKSFGSSSVPLWTKQQFVSNVFSLFNSIIAYDSFTKTITVNLFDKIKQKTPIDLSEFISVETEDYTEFISNYAMVNNFSYDEGNDPDVQEYNVSQFIKYGAGMINVDNDFIEKNTDVLESEFASPVSYINRIFNSSLERINYVELEEIEEFDITSVTDSGGVPRFNITDADDHFISGRLVRIDTDVVDYNGDFVITSVTSSYITVNGLDYGSNATGTATSLQHQLTTDDNVYIFVFSGQQDTNDLFDKNSIFIDSTASGNFAIAYFNLLKTGNVIDSLFKQGLSFGSINSPLSFQRNLLQSYWRQFERVLNDPVKLMCVGNLPWKVYNEIDFLRPITIRSIETSNLYYCNRISGYKNSFMPCGIELIKLP